MLLLLLFLSIWLGLGQPEERDRSHRSVSETENLQGGELGCGGVAAGEGGGQEPEQDALCFETRTVESTSSAWAQALPRGSCPPRRGGRSSPGCTLPPRATVILFTKHSGAGGGGRRIQRLPTPVPRKPSQETGCRLHGMSQTCSVCRHFPGIHVPLAVCHRP